MIGKNILIDLLYVTNKPGGSAIYGVKLTKEIEKILGDNNQITIFTSTYIPFGDCNVNVINHPILKLRVARILFQLLVFPIYLCKKGVNIYFNPSVQIPLYKICGVEYITVIHDFIPFYKKNKYSILRHMYIKWLSLHSLKNSDSIIFVSKNTYTDSKKLIDISKKRYAIAPPASQFMSAEIIEKTFTPIIFLYNGAIEPGKNLLFFLDVWSEYTKIFKDDQFIISSGITWRGELKRVERIILENQMNKSVLIKFQYKTTDEIINMYQKATFFVYASEFEGFGIPILEAIQYGCIPIASNSSGMSEILGRLDHSLVGFDKNDWLKYMIRMRKMIQNAEEYREYLEKMKNVYSQFTWQKSAKIVSEIFIGE